MVIALANVSWLCSGGSGRASSCDSARRAAWGFRAAMIPAHTLAASRATLGSALHSDSNTECCPRGGVEALGLGASHPATQAENPCASQIRTHSRRKGWALASGTSIGPPRGARVRVKSLSTIATSAPAASSRQRASDWR